MFSPQKVPVSQATAIVDENPARTAFAGQDFESASVSDWTSLKGRISRF